ncbi:MAG TPA: hypothetical protein VK988_03115 [Acidimicrobiales bacterium]|nr:hypothetical protein [Acidimicrobiales bacterium]
MSAKWDLKVEAAFGAAPFEEPAATAWTDLSATGNGVRSLRSFRHGKAKRFDPLDPASAELVLDNINGRLDPNNPNSPYFPNVRRDTPIRLTLDSRDTSNLLGIDQAAFEGPNLVGWENNARATLSISDVQPGDDERAMRIEANATGRVSVKTVGTGTNAIPVQGATVYTIQAAFLAATVAHKVKLHAVWYDITGTVITASSSVLLEAPFTIAYTPRAVSFKSPSNARGALLVLDVSTADTGNEAAVGEVFYIRRVSIAKGDYKPWTRPGGLYPLLRGPAMSWTASYDQSLNDATCELVVHDISRSFATHRLWPSIAEHDILDGHAGPPPVSYYPLDERASEHDEFDVMDRVGGRPAITTNDVRSTGNNILQWDTRPFKAFGGGQGQKAQTLFVQSLSSQELDGPWSIDFMFKLERVGFPTQTIFNSENNTIRVFVFEDSRLFFEVTYSDGTTASVSTPFRLIPGPIEHCTLTCEADGTIELWLNRVFRGFAGGGGRVPGWWGVYLIVGADLNGGFGLSGSIGRLSLYNYRQVQHQIEARNDAIKFPWGFSANVGWRLAFLLSEFRHRKDRFGTVVPGTYPGIPFAWKEIDDPSDVLVQDANPASRTMLEYMRALEATEGGYLKIKRNGNVRFRRRSLVLNSRAAGIHFDNRMTVVGRVPYRKAVVGRTDEVLSTVTYSRSGADAQYTVENQDAVKAYGEVDHTIQVESETPGLATQAANDVLFRSAFVPPMPRATVMLRPDDPKVGWYSALVEPGTAVRLDTAFPQYFHSQGYEVLETRHEATPDQGWTTTLELVGNP